MAHGISYDKTCSCAIKFSQKLFSSKRNSLRSVSITIHAVYICSKMSPMENISHCTKNEVFYEGFLQQMLPNPQETVNGNS